MITLSNLLDKMLMEKGVICMEGGHEKAFNELSQKTALLNISITRADSFYSYVFYDSMMETSEENYDLVQLLFIFDQILSSCDEDILEVDNILEGAYESAANK